MSDVAVPAGYVPLDVGSAYMKAQGGFHVRRQEGSVSVGLYVNPQQVNSNGGAHGGLIATVVDVAMSVAILERTGAETVSTIHLSLDYAAPVMVGQWLAVHAQVYRQTARMAFVQCRITAAEVEAGHASGVFRCKFAAPAPG